MDISSGKFLGNVVNIDSTECYGGAVYLYGKENVNVNIQNCEFTMNSVKNKGAALYLAGSGNIEISGCNFTSNTVSDSLVGIETGGTIYKGNGSSITILIDGENKFENTQVWNPSF